jgi:hypothetical protein
MVSGAVTGTGRFPLIILDEPAGEDGEINRRTDPGSCAPWGVKAQKILDKIGTKTYFGLELLLFRWVYFVVLTHSSKHKSTVDEPVVLSSAAIFESPWGRHASPRLRMARPGPTPRTSFPLLPSVKNLRIGRVIRVIVVKFPTFAGVV